VKLRQPAMKVMLEYRIIRISFYHSKGFEYQFIIPTSPLDWLCGGHSLYHFRQFPDNAWPYLMNCDREVVEVQKHFPRFWDNTKILLNLLWWNFRSPDYFTNQKVTMADIHTFLWLFYCIHRPITLSQIPRLHPVLTWKSSLSARIVSAPTVSCSPRGL